MSRPLFLACAVLALQGCASVGNPSQAIATSVPQSLQTDKNESAAFRHFARGVQIYQCEAQAGNSASWKFVAPDAQLFSDSRSEKVLGTHGAGPFWRASDGSRVVGTVKSRADAPSSTAIPWLLLSMKADAAQGEMSRVSSIQRIDTVGGIAPTGGCAGVADHGKQSRVPYTAVYVYFTKT